MFGEPLNNAGLKAWMNDTNDKLTRIENRQEDSIIMLQIALVNHGKLTVDIADIAQLEGVSERTLRPSGDNRYLLPRFGESAYPTGITRWTLSEYLAWHQKDNYEKQALYRDYQRQQKAIKDAEAKASKSNKTRRDSALTG